MAHRVPLSPLTLALLDIIKVEAGESRWLFPSPRDDKPVTGSGVDHALRKNRADLDIVDVTPHDLRRSAASHMTGLGINRLVVGKLALDCVTVPSQFSPMTSVVRWQECLRIQTNP